MGAWRPFCIGLHSPTVEAFFATLLVLSGLFITWFTVYVVYKLYKGQS